MNGRLKFVSLTLLVSVAWGVLSGYVIYPLTGHAEWWLPTALFAGLLIGGPIGWFGAGRWLS